MLSDALVDEVQEVAGAARASGVQLSGECDSRRGKGSSVLAGGGLDRDWPEDAIYLDDWAAQDLGAKNGDPVTLEYYYWEPSGSLVTRTATFQLAAILPMTGRNRPSIAI